MKVAVLLVACMMAMLPAVMAFAFGGAPGGGGGFPGGFKGGAPGGAKGGGPGAGKGGAKGGAPPADAAGDSGGLPTEPSCPESDGFEPLYIADPDDCTKYKVCSGGFGMKLDCPPGLHFNKVTGKCDFPLHAKCEEGTSIYSWCPGFVASAMSTTTEAQCCIFNVPADTPVDAIMDSI
ncbi:hypothetical protein HPB47_015297 [Ixodes persulcatus]|uniref:Uncharacterized protein n=1 Tax=Ixodes persulcatus TaxID=34615 RepID=A0AC60QTU9_IXOPE|nr:hypothetical protein HPB47_015297 [Ixodes persulcatus]